MARDVYSTESHNHTMITNATPGTKSHLQALALIAVLCAAAYSVCMHGPFLFDDYHSIVDNPYITSLSDIPGFFYRSQAEAKLIEHSGWRPLWYTSFAINYFIGGLDTLSYHLTNLALHIADSFLVYMLALALLKGRARDTWPAAVIAGVLFASHPLQTESVSYIVSRSGLMSAFFYLSAMLLYIRYREGGERLYCWA